MSTNNQKYIKFLLKKTSVLSSMAIVGSILLFTDGPHPDSPRSYKTIWDLGHVILFSIISYIVLLGWTSQKRTIGFRQIFWIILIVSVLGILIELTQSGTGRSPDVLDVMRNVIGALVAISFWAPLSDIIKKHYIKYLRVATIILLICALIPPVIAITDEILAFKQFPVLSDFETPFELDRWSGGAKRAIDHNYYFHGNSSMKVVLDTSRYSGVTLKYFPKNWTNYKTLLLSIFNPDDEPITITCRIHDRRHAEGEQNYHDRFNQRYTLQKGWDLITIPLEQIKHAPNMREMDLRQIQALGIFTTGLLKPAVIYIDDVRLID